MRALVQLVTSASVTVDQHIVGDIGIGYLVLFCAMLGDTEDNANWLAQKIVNLRVFDDLQGP